MQSDTDPLFKALCRPPMAAGVPYLLCILNMSVNVILFVLTSNIMFYTVVPAFFHVACYLLCLRDPFKIAVWETKVTQCPLTRNGWAWRCQSYAP